MEIYNIHIPSMLFTSELGEENVELPYSKELDDAVLLINSIAAKKVYKMRRESKDIYENEINYLKILHNYYWQ